MRIDLTTVHLSSGKHEPNDTGDWCVEELVAALAGEPWSDAPQCVSPVIASYARVLNDRLRDEERQQLIEVAGLQIGTRGDGSADIRRAYLCADRAVRVFVPAALRAAKLDEWAVTLEQFAPIVDLHTARAASNAASAAARASNAAADVATAAYAAASNAAASAAAYAAAADAAAYAAASNAAAADAAAAAAAAAAYAAAAADAAAVRRQIVAAAVQLLRDLCEVTE